MEDKYNTDKIYIKELIERETLKLIDKIRRSSDEVKLNSDYLTQVQWLKSLEAYNNESTINCFILEEKDL